MSELTQEPQGIGFYNIKSDETHYAKLEPTIQAYINSSDMGINASRGQDFGWRLDPEWVKKVKAFRRDATQMQILTGRNGGQQPSDVQVLYYLYGEELRAYQEALEENENPYEEAYRDRISGRTEATEVESSKEDDMADVIDDAVTKPVEKTTKKTQKEQ